MQRYAPRMVIEDDNTEPIGIFDVHALSWAVPLKIDAEFREDRPAMTWLGVKQLHLFMSLEEAKSSNSETYGDSGQRVQSTKRNSFELVSMCVRLWTDFARASSWVALARA